MGLTVGHLTENEEIELTQSLVVRRCLKGPSYGPRGAQGYEDGMVPSR